MCETITHQHNPQDEQPVKIELADIFLKYKHLLSYADDDGWKVINAITSCRTQKLGSHKWTCDNCGYSEISYNSCRNRHCPKCLGLAKAAWIIKRDAEILPVPYFHLVFTIPALFNDLVLVNKRIIYSLLYRACSQTLKEVIANPDNLGATCGFFAILHTWDQRLNLHPHIHCVVPGGGLSEDKTQWVASRENFLVSVRKLSLVFRGKFVSRLEQLYNNNKIVFNGKLSALENPPDFKALLVESCRTEWVVYAKKPFNGPHWVVRYLARYTHRIAISNSRILSCENDKVTFKWCDRKNGYVQKLMTMDAVIFMQKYLLHVLPPRFIRIRYYGFMGNKVRKESIELIRALTGECRDNQANTKELPSHWVDMMIYLTGKDPTICKKCHTGHMVESPMPDNELAGCG